jgi:hypothetical protein
MNKIKYYFQIVTMPTIFSLTKNETVDLETAINNIQRGEGIKDFKITHTELLKRISVIKGPGLSFIYGQYNSFILL